MLIPVLSAGNFVIGMGAFVIIGLMAPLADDFGVTSVQTGLLLTVYAVAYAIGSPLCVALTGGLARWLVLLAGIGIFGAAALGSALAPDLTTLYAARVAAAIGAGLFTPTAAAVAAGVAEPHARGAALAQVFFGLTLAQVLGVPAGGWIAYTFGWRIAFALVAILSIPVIIGVLRLVPRDLVFQPNRLSALIAALGDLRGMATVLFTATFLGAIYVIYTYLSPLLTEFQGFGRDGITLALLIFGIGAVIGNLAGGRLGDAIGPQRTLIALAGAQILLMPVFSLLPLSNILLMALMLTWSICGWSFMAPQQMRLIHMAPERQNVVLALNAASIYVGASIGSALGGWVIEAFGLGTLGIAAGLAGIAALLNVWATPVRRP